MKSKMKSKYIVPTLALVGVLTTAQADALKVEVGAGVWSATPKGTITYKGSTNDLESQFGLEKESTPYFYADIQHPVPILPNFRLEYVNISSKGNSNAPIKFGGQNFNVGTNLTEVELKTIDFIIYYNLWDSLGINADLGLDIKYIDGFASVENQMTRLKEKVDLKAPIPHLYGNLRYDFSSISSIDLGIETSLKYFTYDGATSHDWILKVDYNIFKGFKVEAGYRNTGIDIPEDVANDYDLDASLNYKFTGPFIGINYTF